ncbi:hypothetical protein L7F22_026371 [Adiantum nelumboides]|nr:hypothetical protein [Adiantum nelumboides]
MPQSIISIPDGKCGNRTEADTQEGPMASSAILDILVDLIAIRIHGARVGVGVKRIGVEVGADVAVATGVAVKEPRVAAELRILLNKNDVSLQELGSYVDAREATTNDEDLEVRNGCCVTR